MIFRSPRIKIEVEQDKEKFERVERYKNYFYYNNSLSKN